MRNDAPAVPRVRKSLALVALALTPLPMSDAQQPTTVDTGVAIKRRWLCHRYSLIGDNSAVVTERQQRHLKLLVGTLCVTFGCVLFGNAASELQMKLTVLPPPPALPPLPPPIQPPSPPPQPPPSPPYWQNLVAPAELPQTFGTEMPPPNTATCAWERLAATASACTGVECADEDAFAAPIYRCTGDGHRSFLVGPFTSSVGSWYSVAATVPLLRRGDRITRYTGDAVSASDATTVISYPPLHMHHIHVWSPDGESGHWWETHGDYARADDDTNNDQLFDYSLASPPAGKCVVYDEDKPLVIDAQLNDVRFSTGTAMARDHAGAEDPSTADLGAAAPPYSWYLRIAFEVERQTTSAVRTCAPVHKLVMLYPVDAHALNDRLGRFDAGSRETVFVWTHRLPYGGTVALPVHNHVHRARYAGHMMLRGEHTLAGLVGGATGQSLGSLIASLPPTNRTATLRRIVRDRARADGSLLCSDNPSEPTFVSRPEGGDGMGGFFDRRGRLECEPFAFGAGDLVTVILFSRPIWASHLTVFPQHAMIFLFYTPLNGTRAPILSMVRARGYPAGYTITDLDGTRSLRCAQPPDDVMPPSWEEGAYDNDGVVGEPPDTSALDADEYMDIMFRCVGVDG